MKKKMTFHSQCRQDRIINILFRGRTGGVFLDIGAHDGISFSNTCFFEKEKKWTGICIEPNPEIFKQLRSNRGCILENCCVSNKEGKVTFRKVNGPSSMLSGILDFFDDRHIIRIEHELSVVGGSYEDISIPAKTLEGVLTENNIMEIDYCSIDAEGAEFPIIKSIDFDRFSIKSLSVENNYRDMVVRDYLRQKGYYCVSCGQEDFYIKDRNMTNFLFIAYTAGYSVYCGVKHRIKCVFKWMRRI